MRRSILSSIVMTLIILFAAGNALTDETLALYYAFDDGAGDEASDSSEYSNHGVMVPGADWIDGKYGQAIQITAAAGHVETLPSDTLSADIFVESFTLTAYINPSLSDTWGHIWRSRPNPGSGHNTLFVNVAGFLSWRGIAGGAWTTLCEGPAGGIVPDEWQHIAVVSDESNFRIYINGEMVVETAYAETDGAIETFYVGGDGQSENYTGGIDEVALWNRALSDGEILAAVDGVKSMQAVDFADKLATTWGGIKAY